MIEKHSKKVMVEDLRGMKFGKLEVIDFDWERYISDEIRREHGEIKHFHCHWICKCDCGNTLSTTTNKLKKKIQSCGNCNNVVYGTRKSNRIVKRRPVIKKKSFEQWCKDNDHQDYLDLWDYELNVYHPSEIGCGSSRKVYFKCPKMIHESESQVIHDLTMINSKYGTCRNGLWCKKCNSFGEYLIGTFGNLSLWSDKNTKNPFDVAKYHNEKVKLICLDCKEEKDITCSSFITQGLACGCGDGQSYPNKFVTSLLKQIGLEVKTEKVFRWSNNKRYDAYLPKVSCIIENHGIQHYDDKYNWRSVGGRNLKEEQENDSLKHEIALNNGIKYYIVIDCRKSDVDWIKNSVMNSELPDILGFKENDVNWIECHEFALKNLVRETCWLWDSGEFKSTKEIGNYLNIGRDTIIRYLKAGNALNWCHYIKEEDGRKLNCGVKRKKIVVIKDNVELYIAESATFLERQSHDLLGVKLWHSAISMVCTGKMKAYKGFVFRFAEDNE